MNYFLHILILINIYLIVAFSLNLITGYTGILSLAHAGFYGIGAYVSSIMAINFGTSFFLNLPLVILFSGLFAVFISLSAIRLHDDYLVVATFGFQIIIFSIFNNWVSLTRGPMGLLNIPHIQIFKLTVNSHFEYFIFSSIVTFLFFLVIKRIVRSPFGRVLKAVREDEIFALSLGKNIHNYKILVFIIGGSLAAVAGAIYAHYVTFIDPTSFSIIESILMISIVIIGGAGSILGSIVGTVILILIPEVLRFFGMPNSIAANMRQIIYGGLLVIFMLFRPKGIIGEYKFVKK